MRHRVWLVVAILALSGCTTLALRPSTQERIRQLFLRAVDRVCSMPVERQQLFDKEIREAGLRGIEIRRLCISRAAQKGQ